MLRFAFILIITLVTTAYRSILSYIPDLSNFFLISFIIHQYCWNFPILQIFLKSQSSLIPPLVLCFCFINISLVLAHKIWCNCFNSVHFLVSLLFTWPLNYFYKDVFLVCKGLEMFPVTLLLIPLYLPRVGSLLLQFNFTC